MRHRAGAVTDTRGTRAPGRGGAIAPPTALALTTTTFREGPWHNRHNRAFGIFAAAPAWPARSPRPWAWRPRCTDPSAPPTTGRAAAALGHHVLAEGIPTAFWAGAGLAGLAAVVALFAVRVRKGDLEALSGAADAAKPGAS